jgi:hypothetical protein
MTASNLPGTHERRIRCRVQRMLAKSTGMSAWRPALARSVFSREAKRRNVRGQSRAAARRGPPNIKGKLREYISIWPQGLPMTSASPPPLAAEDEAILEAPTTTATRTKEHPAIVAREEAAARRFRACCCQRLRFGQAQLATAGISSPCSRVQARAFHRASITPVRGRPSPHRSGLPG